MAIPTRCGYRHPERGLRLITGLAKSTRGGTVRQILDAAPNFRQDKAMPPPLHDPIAAPLPDAKVEIKTTTCYMCACRCGIRVHLRDGEVRYIEGNPDHPLNKGVICAKGGSGIMKQYSPARLTKPLRRKAGSERGANQFEEISWDETFDILEKRLSHLRATDPKKFALFTGRDQMQALTGLFARQFGTPNYAAHGGFCSVNMAAGMIYTIGGSFWEFGGPDLERANLFFMIGTAEDHHSNPLKGAIGDFKRNGGRFVAINPVRSGYAAIADEWIPIKPGTDGALLLAIIREIIALGLYDREFLARYTNSGQLVNQDETSNEFGMMMRKADGDIINPLRPHNFCWWDRMSDQPVADHTKGTDPALFGSFVMPDGTPVKPAFQLLKERVAECTPGWAEAITGIPAATIKRIAHEMGVTARDRKIELPIPWTDWWGEEHESVTGNPVAFHAMRGLAAHSNGFQTIRALSILMSLLGTIDRPGGFRHKAPYPRAIPPNLRPPKGPEGVQPNTPLGGAPLGWMESPDDLFVDADGQPVRIDKAFSWEHPLSSHGLMHNVITNAWRGDPYPIDTLFLFMANMAWNSTMNTSEVRNMLTDKGADGDYKIPFIVVCDAFQSETTAFADLILPDTTYLERHDCMSMLDRPISEYDGPVDSVRIPVLPPTGECKPFQEVLVELAGRLKLPAFTNAEGGRKFRNYPDFVVELRNRAGFRHRFPLRLARQGWREGHARRAESEAVGNVREERLLLPVPPAAFQPVHAQLEQGIHGVGAADRDASRQRPDRHPHLFRTAAGLPAGRAGQAARQAAARQPARTRRHLLRPAAVLVCAARGQAERPAALPAQCRDAAPDGDVPLVGLPECLAAPDPHLQLPPREYPYRQGGGNRGRRMDVGGVAMGQGALPVPPFRGGRTGHGMDMERDRQVFRRMEPGGRCQ